MINNVLSSTILISTLFCFQIVKIATLFSKNPSIDNSFSDVYSVWFIVLKEKNISSTQDRPPCGHKIVPGDTFFTLALACYGDGSDANAQKNCRC